MSLHHCLDNKANLVVISRSVASCAATQQQQQHGGMGAMKEKCVATTKVCRNGSVSPNPEV